MNPWIYIWYGFGWLIIAVAVIFIVAFVIASIKVAYDRVKKKKQKPDIYKIFSSGD